MFDQTFVEATQSDKQPITLVFSLMLQAFAICLLTLIPLLYTEALPAGAIKSLLVAPATPPVAVPKPSTPQVQPKPAARVLDPRTLFARVAVPKQIPLMDPATPAPEVSITGAVGEANGSGAPSIISLLGSVPEARVPTPVESQPKSKPVRQPVRFGGRVAEANLLRKVMPVYPPLAKSTHVQGTVEFTALISKDGNIENLQLVHGHPLLVKAAKEAVLQWKYRPTTLNGGAVEVITDIVVNFTLSQ